MLCNIKHKYAMRLLPATATTMARCYSSKDARHILSQDPESIPEYKMARKDGTENRVYSWGFTRTGAVAAMNKVKPVMKNAIFAMKTPRRISFSVTNEVTNATVGYGFTAFAVKRMDNYTVFAAGINTDGQLGYQPRGPASNRRNLEIIVYPTPVVLPIVEGETSNDMSVRCMSAGRAHFVMVTRNGTVFTMGNNAYGQCGRTIINDEDYQKSARIQRLPEAAICGPNDQILAVECGQDHTLFLTKLGRVYACGCGSDGQLGNGDHKSTHEIVRVDGDIKGERIVQLASKADTVLALNEVGEVFGWGNAEHSQFCNANGEHSQISTPIALPATRSIGRIKEVACGGTTCMALSDEGLAYTWGNGIVGHGPYHQTLNQPKLLPPPLFGRNEFAKDVCVTSIACGLTHMGAINSVGDCYTWGHNTYGQLGLNDLKTQFFPFKVALNAKVKRLFLGVDHSIAIGKPIYEY